MTPQQRDQIRASWALVESIADTAAVLFYDRLFELDPTLRRLFARTDMAAQRGNLMQALTVVMTSIDRLETIIPAVEALGRRHAGYGVRASRYATVGRALLDTLKAGLGEACTAEVQAAWGEAYELLAGVMLAAAGGEDAQAA